MQNQKQDTQYTQTSKILLRRLIREFINPYKKKLFLALLCMIIGALATSALPYLLKPVFDDVFIKGEMSMLIWVSLFVLTAFILKGASAYGEAVLMTFVGQSIIADIQKKLFKHLMHADLGYFHNTPTGELISRFTNDVTLMRSAMATTLLSIGKDSLTLIFLVSLMFYMDPTLSMIAFVVFPSAVLPIAKIGRRMRKVTHKTQDEHADLNNQLSQLFQGIRVVKAYGMEDFEVKHIHKIIDNVFSLVYRSTKIRSATHPIVESLGGVAIVAVIAYGGYQVIHNSRTAGDFIAFIAALLLVYEPLKRLSSLHSNLQEGLAATARVFEMLDTKPSIKNSLEVRPFTNNIQGHIELKSVGFVYPLQEGNGNSDVRTHQNLSHRPILTQLSIEAKPGQTIALVGASGAGKSTIINLIPRFYDVTQGCILIDGRDIRDVSLKDLRSQISLVSQEISLFDRSIVDNIAYSEKIYSMQEILQASKDAFAHDFIEELPNGYMTEVGENGVKLSGGQRQRIAIARAMLKNAPILLLDEATSALDSESERQIQEALERLMKGKTSVIVAHRLSTIVKADWIYVMEKGTVVEEGRHEELLSLKGIYSNLWTQQAKGKEI